MICVLMEWLEEQIAQDWVWLLPLSPTLWAQGRGKLGAISFPLASCDGRHGHNEFIARTSILPWSGEYWACLVTEKGWLALARGGKEGSGGGSL
jgi:hypothetical protein